MSYLQQQHENKNQRRYGAYELPSFLSGLQRTILDKSKQISYNAHNRARGLDVAMK